jgi:predicted hotdog family 3-hydroxylacyl-ACP dehydratase
MMHKPETMPVADLIPHQANMCLLERILEWDDERIRLAASSHRSPAHPLRDDGRLRAVHLCEYGAQAMAVHGALKARAHGGKPEPGVLVSLRAVTFHRDFIDDLPHDLHVEAHCLQATAASLQYQFRITHGDELIAEGRAAVVLGTVQP